MSQETIDILKSQLPLFEKLRRSAMLTYAMRGTATKKKLLDYIMSVQEMAWQILQLNEHTIAQMEKELGVQDDTTTSSEGGSPATREAQLAEIAKALGENAGVGPQLVGSGGGTTEVDPRTPRTAG